MRTERATVPLVIDDIEPQRCPLCCKREIIWTFRGWERSRSRSRLCLRCFISIRRPEFLQEPGPLRQAMTAHTAECDEWMDEGRSVGELRSKFDFRPQHAGIAMIWREDAPDV